jgi:hypothetical protein
VFCLNKLVLSDHLRLNSITAAGVYGSCDYNPLQKNSRAVNYKKSDVQASDPTLTCLLTSIMTLFCATLRDRVCSVLLLSLQQLWCTQLKTTSTRSIKQQQQ